MEFKLALQVMGKDMEAALPENILLELALLSDAEMAELNESYLDCAGPTNVLAFPAPDASWRNTPDKKNLPHQSLHKSLGQTLGWMALAPVTLRREALLYKQNLSTYTLRLLAHGFAHLMGYEHGELMDEVSAKAARAAQLELLHLQL
jgi:probable rRNA maturation factor